MKPIQARHSRSSWELGSFGALDQADRRTAGYLIRHGAKIDIHSASKHGMLDRVQKRGVRIPITVDHSDVQGALPPGYSPRTVQTHLRSRYATGGVDL